MPGIKGKHDEDSPFGLMWDTLASPVSIPGCPICKTRFPLIICQNNAEIARRHALINKETLPDSTTWHR